MKFTKEEYSTNKIIKDTAGFIAPDERFKHYKGDYYVSNYGRLWSTKRNKIIRLDYNSTGRLRGAGTVDGTYIKFLMHRAVASLFLPNDNPEEKTLVHHINTDYTDNSVDNLMWVSDAEHKAIHAVYNHAYKAIQELRKLDDKTKSIVLEQLEYKVKFG